MRRQSSTSSLRRRDSFTLFDYASRLQRWRRKVRSRSMNDMASQPLGGATEEEEPPDGKSENEGKLKS